MKKELIISAIQANIVWEQPHENRLSFKQHIHRLSEKTDLVVLPEMFTTGFSMNPQSIAETMGGETVEWMVLTATSLNIALVGSLVIKEEGRYFNRVVFVHPEGMIETYDKRHSFGLAGENLHYTSGTERLIVNYKGWKIQPLICYDLRFPVWSRYTNDYDVLLYMANWPKPRILAWDVLLQARAIENMSYCLGVNRIGKDKNGHEYIGHTAIYDFLGKPIRNTKEESEDFIECKLSKASLYEARKQLNFLNDRDTFRLV